MTTRREVQIMGYDAWEEGKKLGCPQLRYWHTGEGVDHRSDGLNELDVGTWVAEGRDPCPHCARGEHPYHCHNKGRASEFGHKLILVDPPFEKVGA